MDAVAISPLRRLARACGAGLLLAAGCLIVSAVVGSGEARADQSDDSTPGILGGVLNTVADVAEPVLDTVGEVTHSVTDAVAPVTAPVAQSVTTPAQAPAAPVSPSAPGPAPAAPVEPPSAPAAPTEPITRIVAPVLEIVDGVPVVGSLADSLGVSSLLRSTVTAVDEAIPTVDSTLDTVLAPVPTPVLPVVPIVPAIPETIDTALPAATMAVPSGETALGVLRGLAAPTILGVDSVVHALGSTAPPPSSSASMTDPPGPLSGWSALLSSFGSPATASGSSSGSALGVALVAAFLFVAHLAWVRRGPLPDERVPAGPALRTLPSPD